MTQERTAHGAKTLAAAYYTDSAVYRAESEAIFGQSWLCLGRAAEIAQPGQYRLRQVENESLIVLRDHDGTVRTFYNVCRHRGTRLCTAESGRFSRSIQCPYHAWTYGLDGRLLGAPNMNEVADFDKADYPLVGVETAVWQGFIFVNLAPKPRPFAEGFAPIHDKFGAWDLERLQSARQIVYDVNCNWKLLFQNYSECYHCPTAHPTLNQRTHYRDASNDLEEGPFLGGPMKLSADSSSMTLNGRACAAPLGQVGGEALKLVYYYTIFPTIFLSLHPDYVLVHRLERLDVDRTRVICDWLFAPEAIAAPDFDSEPAVAFWDMTNRQDWQLCEWSQAGISSRVYRPGPYAELESQLAAFDRHYLAQMGSSQ
jgi:glycine betaine catabolism A